MRCLFLAILFAATGLAPRAQTSPTKALVGRRLIDGFGDWPSVAMKVDKDVGTVTPGNADIIAVKGDALRHIALLQRVDVIVKHGVRYK